MTITRALSIRQPFVELILQGKKKFEYRSMPTNIRERIYLYASLQPGGRSKDQSLTGKTLDGLQKGLIVGTVEIVDCKWDSKNDCYAYELATPKRILKPLKATNQPCPRFWRPTF